MRLVAAAFHDAGDNPEDDETEEDGNHDNEPKWANDDGLFNSGIFIKDFDDGFDLENTDTGGIVPSDFSVTASFWEDGKIGNDFFAIAVGGVAIFEAIIEEIANFE